ncbi:MAG: DUF2939 domain-containing protein [Candidatus Thiodiazotropha sp.]
MKSFIALLVLIALAFLAWPYTAIYRLDQALQQNDQATLEAMIDVQSVRDQIKRKLNKNVQSNIGSVSSGFVDWLQDGIRRLGSDAIDEMVDTAWVVNELRAHNPDPRQGGIMGQLSYAFFDGPDRLLLRIGEWEDNPVHAHLTLEGTRWRVTAVYN